MSGPQSGRLGLEKTLNALPLELSKAFEVTARRVFFSPSAAGFL